MSDPRPGEDPEIPDAPPEHPGGGESEVDDQPLGAPTDLEAEEAPAPGLPEAEPPSSG